LSDQSELISLVTWGELFWSLWGFCQPVCGFVCFDEVRKSKVMYNNPWFPVCYILHPHEEISSHMMGNEVLGGTLPHPRLREFSWLMELQRSWGVFEVTPRNSSCLPKCGFPIGRSMEQYRNVIPAEPRTSWQGFITPWQWVFEEITLSLQCFLVFIMYWCCWEELYLEESPETLLHQNT
jgi:hypothetical protein